MRKLLAILSWTGITAMVLFLSLSFYLNVASMSPTSSRPQLSKSLNEAISSHAILPQVLGAFSFSVKTNDAIPEIIRQYLERYQSPLLPHTDYLVETAREYDLDPRLLVAVAQQESNLCKKIPDNSYNCWGWGIHSQGTLRYESYPKAIEAVCKGLAENYFGKGLNTPEEIMGIYTPLSDGSWARGVQQFLDEMN